MTDLRGLVWQAEDPLAGWVMHNNPAWSMVGWRFYEDDAAEGSATPYAAENAAADIQADATFRLRIEVQETNNGSTQNATHALQYRLNGGAWTAVTTTSSVAQSTTSASLTEGDATTNVLTSGTGTFVPGEVDTNGTAGEGNLIDYNGNDHTECVYILTMPSADVAQGDTVDFRVLADGATIDYTPGFATVNVVKVFSGPAAQTLAPVTQSASGTSSYTAGSYAQAAFRLYENDGAANSATPLAAQNANASIAEESDFRVRFEIQDSVADSSDPHGSWQLQYRRNAGTWELVTGASSFVRGTAPTGASTGDATTDLLTAGTGTFVPGKLSGTSGDVDGVFVATQNHTELVYPVVFLSSVVATDTIELRVVYGPSDTPLTTYTNTPTITVTPRYSGPAAQTLQPVSQDATGATIGVEYWTGTAWTTTPTWIAETGSSDSITNEDGLYRFAIAVRDSSGAESDYTAWRNVQVGTVAATFTGDIAQTLPSIGQSAAGKHLTGYASEVWADSPLAYFRLGEPSGTTVVDESPGGNDGEYVNSPTLGVTGLLSGDSDTAIDIDGTDVNFPRARWGPDPSWIPTGGNFTIEVWIQTTKTTSKSIVGYGDTNEMLLFVSSTTTLLNSGGSTVGTLNHLNVSDGSPHQIVWTFDGTTHRLYVDGAFADSATGGAWTSKAGAYLVAGQEQDSADGGYSTTQAHDGVIDELSFYDVALSAARITAHYDAGAGSTFTGDIAQTLQAVAQDAAGTVSDPVFAGSAAQTLQPVAQDATGTHTEPTWSGPIAQTLQPVTQEATGTHVAPTFAGTAAQSLAAATQDATGTVLHPVYSGTAAQSLAAATQDATGTVGTPVYDGPAAQTLPTLSQSATGTVADPVYSGPAAQTLAAATQDATGAIADPVYSGTAAQTLQPVSQDATGTVVDPVYSGAAAQTLAAATQDATGAVADPVFGGTAAQTLVAATQDATGAIADPAFDGPAAQTLQPVSQDATGTVADPVFSGPAAQTLAAPSQDATGTVADPVYSGTAAQTLAAASQDATGTVAAPVYDGPAAQTLPTLTQDATGTIADPVDSGPASQTLPALTQAATGTVADPVDSGPALQTLPALTQSATGTSGAPAFDGPAAQTLPSVSQDATGTVIAPVYSGTVAQAVQPISQQATGTNVVPTSSGTAAQSLAAASQQATGAVADPVFGGTAAQTLQTASQDATGTIADPVYAGTAAQALAPVTQSASGTSGAPAFDGPAAQTLQPVSQDATGTHVAPVFSGTAGSVLGAATQDATGAITTPVYSGTANQTLQAASQSASGTSGAPAFDGSAAQTLQPASQSATGTTTPPVFSGTAGSGLPSLSTDATGAVADPVFGGSATSSLSPVSQAASGTAAPPSFTGTAASVGPTISQSATGFVVAPTYTGSITSALAAVEQAAQGDMVTTEVAGTIAQTFGIIVTVATGTFVPTESEPSTPFDVRMDRLRGRIELSPSLKVEIQKSLLADLTLIE